MNQVVDELVRDGQLEKAPPDPRAADRMLEEATRHVEAVRLISEVDRSGAYVLCYDAARKAITALLLANGFRALAVPGSHATIARAALSLASSVTDRSRLRLLNEMRRHRNRAEYGVRAFSRQEVEGAIDAASWMITFVRRRLSG